MSAEVTLAGLFPPNGNQIWNKNIHWQPIPVHTVPRDLDYLLAVRKPCDRLKYISIECQNTTAYSKIFDEYQSIIEQLRAFTGSKLDTLHDIFFLHSVLSIELSKKFT